jgi:hypothetical protein
MASDLRSPNGIRTRVSTLRWWYGHARDAARWTKPLLRGHMGISPYRSVLFLVRHVCGTPAVPGSTSAAPTPMVGR